MSAILVDWVIEVHDKFDLMPETLYLTVNLVDRFLAVKMVPRRELQLLGINSEDGEDHSASLGMGIDCSHMLRLPRPIHRSLILDNEMEKNLVVVVSGEEVSSIKLYLEYLKPLVSKLDTPTDLREHLAPSADDPVDLYGYR
ncbi:hypothetical protein Dimus_037164, partial [Dionaea muscipula]